MKSLIDQCIYVYPALIFPFFSLSISSLKMGLWKVTKSKPPVVVQRPQSRYEAMKDTAVNKSRELMDSAKQHFTNPVTNLLVIGLCLAMGFFSSKSIPEALVGLLGMNYVIGAILCWVFIECVTHFHYKWHHQNVFIIHLNSFKRGLVFGVLLQVCKYSSK